MDGEGPSTDIHPQTYIHRHPSTVIYPQTYTRRHTSTDIHGLCRNRRRAPEWGVHPGETCRDPARTGSHLAMLEFSLARVGVRVEGGASGSKGGPPTPRLAHLPRFTRPGQSPDLAGARAIASTPRLNEPYSCDILQCPGGPEGRWRGKPRTTGLSGGGRLSSPPCAPAHPGALRGHRGVADAAALRPRGDASVRAGDVDGGDSGWREHFPWRGAVGGWWRAGNWRERATAGAASPVGPGLIQAESPDLSLVGICHPGSLWTDALHRPTPCTDNGDVEPDVRNIPPITRAFSAAKTAHVWE